MIKYTTAYWYTANNNNIDGVGLIPGFTEKLTSKKYTIKDLEVDNQIYKAYGILNKLS